MGKPLPLFIRGTGRCMPVQVRTNADYAKYLDTTDDWIVSRTGIRERHIAREDECASDLATVAPKLALESAGLNSKDVDLIYFATSCPDNIVPASATYLQYNLAAWNAGAVDLLAACA